MIKLTNRSRRAAVIVLAGDDIRCYTGANGRRIVPSLTLMPGATSEPLPNSVEKLDQVSRGLRDGSLRLTRVEAPKAKPKAKSKGKAKSKKKA